MTRRTAKDFDQELLNLYDYYVHGQIDRRAFLDRAARSMSSGQTKTTCCGSIDPSTAG